MLYRRQIWLVTIGTWILASVLVLYTQDVFETDPLENSIIPVTDTISYKSGFSDYTRHYYIKSECGAGIYNLKKLLTVLGPVSGVSNILTSHYKLTISIAPCFKWPGIEDEIIRVIEKHIIECENQMEPVEKEIIS